LEKTNKQKTSQISKRYLFKYQKYLYFSKPTPKSKKKKSPGCEGVKDNKIGLVKIHSRVSERGKNDDLLQVPPDWKYPYWHSQTLEANEQTDPYTVHVSVPIVHAPPSVFTWADKAPATLQNNLMRKFCSEIESI
jgi:hypothetical protein